jgi:hypothetical protein
LLNNLGTIKPEKKREKTTLGAFVLLMDLKILEKIVQLPGYYMWGLPVFLNENF